jgi:hypothetical protein
MFAVEIGVLLLLVREVLISYLCPEIRYGESPFLFWISHVKKNAGTIFQLDNDHFFPHVYEFIIRQYTMQAIDSAVEWAIN